MFKNILPITPKRVIILILLLLIYLVVAISIIELGWTFIRDLLNPAQFLQQSDQLFDLLGMFLVVLVAVELMDTISAYLDENVIHAEVVLEAALIAVARKVIVLNIKQVDAIMVLALAALLAALSVSNILIRKGHILHEGNAKAASSGS